MKTQASPKTLSCLFILSLIFFLQAFTATGQELFSTNFTNAAHWIDLPPTGWTSYNPKAYEEGEWYIHSTEAVRGTSAESFDGSAYSFRDRGIFTVKNTGQVSGMSGFSLQLRDWMLGSGNQRELKLSTDGGQTWESIAVINKSWFDAYQVYQEFIYFFPDGALTFTAEEFMLELDGGDQVNEGRINIGQFTALGAMTSAIAPVFNPAGGFFFVPVDVEITSATPGAQLFYSTTSADGPWSEYTVPVTVEETTTIWAYATTDDLDDSTVSSATFTFPEVVEVNSLADLRTMPDDGSFYKYTGEAVIVAMDGFRNRKFIQDETAAVLIDDQHGIITTQYELYDLISDVIGQINVSSNMIRFQPATNTPVASQNMPVAPYVFTLDQVSPDDQAKLIQFKNVSFANVDEGAVFANGTNYTLTDGVHSFVLRTDFWNIDYIGEPLPLTPLNITGVILQYEEVLQIIPRFAADFEEAETGPGSNASLSVFEVGGKNALLLGGIVVDDPEHDPGAKLYVQDFSGFQGVLVETEDVLAGFTVRINGIEIDAGELDEVDLEHEDELLVKVTAEDQETVKYYKVTTLLEVRELTLVSPGAGDQFVTYQNVVYSWIAEHLDQLLLEVFIEDINQAVFSTVVDAGDEEFSQEVPNGFHGPAQFRLTDLNDPSFFAESENFYFIDNVPPVLIEKYPEDGATDIPFITELILTFDEPYIVPGTGSLHIYKQNDDQLITSMAAEQMSIDGASVSVTLQQDLDHNTTYYILIDDDAFGDLGSNYFEGITDPAYWTFTTAGDDEEPEDIICNGDFESWTSGLPDCWYGSKSNIGLANVNQYAENPYTGSFAVQLINTTNTHSRFTSQAVSVEAEVSYRISFWVKGKGDIRTGLFDDRDTGFGYAQYNDYILVNSDEWSEHSQLVTAVKTTDNAEFIFSLRNTDESMSHLQLDNVSVEVFSEGPAEVSTIAELRNSSIGGLFTITGESILTFQQSYRNQKYIQDETAAIMIDDPNGIITTAYALYDGITGITGSLGVYNQMLQFAPAEDPGPATSSGNELLPEVRTLSSLTSDDQAKLVQVWNVSFEQSGVFSTGQEYDLNSPHGNGIFRTSFFDADYIGETIPSGPQIITALVNQFMNTIQITSRSLQDIEVYTGIAETGTVNVMVFPNPFTDNIYLSGEKRLEKIQLFNAQGQLIAEFAPGQQEYVISVPDLPVGLYVLHLYDTNGQRSTKKIMKR
ncbi:MAG: DUF5689 domain-containing protein [Bacteroidales bacterium]|nr:DUF5689 domain-containing protein [Bacteroidales bacterium]